MCCVSSSCGNKKPRCCHINKISMVMQWLSLSPHCKVPGFLPLSFLAYASSIVIIVHQWFLVFGNLRPMAGSKYLRTTILNKWEKHNTAGETKWAVAGFHHIQHNLLSAQHHCIYESKFYVFRVIFHHHKLQSFYRHRAVSTSLSFKNHFVSLHQRELQQDNSDKTELPLNLEYIVIGCMYLNNWPLKN